MCTWPFDVKLVVTISDTGLSKLPSIPGIAFYVVQAKASVQMTFSRILESLRNREIFLLNQIDIIHQTSEDLLSAQERQLLNSLGPSDSTHISSCTYEENG